MPVLILIAFIAIACSLTWYLLSHDRGPKEPVVALWFAFGIGAAGAVLAYLIETRLIKAGSLSSGSSFSSLFGITMLIALIEESCKFIPLALFLYKKSYFNEHTDGIIYFAIAGLGFGIPENIIYTILGGSQTGLIRLLLTSLFHASTTAVIGYFLAKQKVEKKPLWIVVAAFFAIVIVHGLYDFGLLSGINFLALLSIVITFSLTVALFVLFSRATKLDQKLGLSYIPGNNFCRNCGAANTRHSFYCAQCHKNA
ncbi:MAG: PrsW family intramembrane metalloprotease [Candidatus Saccharimonadales bacterium]